MDPVTGAVVIAGLKYVGKPSADLVKDFVGRILAPTGDVAGKALAQPIDEWQKRRVERAAALVAQAATIVADAGAVPQPVPGRILFPVLERGSVEEDDELFERWAALLANTAIDPDAVFPAFASILEQLSPDEVRVLQHVYVLEMELTDLRRKRGPASGWDELSPEGRPILDLKFRLGVPAVVKELQLSYVELVLTNLQRLSLIYSQSTSVELTQFGQMFVRSCSRPKDVPAG